MLTSIHKRVKKNASNFAEIEWEQPDVKQCWTRNNVSSIQKKLTGEVDYLINMLAGSFPNVLKVTRI